MNLSDSMTVGHPDTWLRDARSAWMLIAARSAEDAAVRGSSEQTRSLHALLAQLCAQSDQDQWESVAAAIYMGLAEASSNRVYEALLYDLWQTLATAGGRWDIAAQLWPMRSWTEEWLQTVIRGISDAEPGRVRTAMDAHLGGVLAMLDA